MTFREVESLLHEDGWEFARRGGNGDIYKHPTKQGIVTVHCHAKGRDIPKGTLRSILKQAGLDYPVC